MRIKFTKSITPIHKGYETDIIDNHDNEYYFLCPDGMTAMMTEKQMVGCAVLLNTDEKIDKLKEAIDGKGE